MNIFNECFLCSLDSNIIYYYLSACMINRPSRVKVYEVVSLIPSPGLTSCDDLLNSRAGTKLHAMVSPTAI